MRYFKNFLATITICISFSLLGSIDSDKYKNEQTNIIIKKISPLLDRHCPKLCELLSVDLEIEDKYQNYDNLGFQSVGSAKDLHHFYSIERGYINIELDHSITSQDRKRLETLITNQVKNISNKLFVRWSIIELPNIGLDYKDTEVIPNKIKKQLRQEIQGVFNDYCPNSCILSRIRVKGSLVSADQADNYPASEIYNLRNNPSFFHIEDITINLTMDRKIDKLEQDKILDIVTAKTNYMSPIAFETKVIDFPETASAKKNRLLQESKDPYGLEKLKKMLILFRDLAGTKEIISTQTDKTSSVLSEKSALESRKNLTEDSNFLYYVLGVLLVLIVLIFVVMKFVSANREAKLLLQTVPGETPGKKENTTTGISDGLLGLLGKGKNKEKEKEKEQVILRLRNESLKEELLQIFIKSPKVAKETFSKLIIEEDVEVTAKYLHILGKVILYEILGDPNLNKDLFELSEYYSKSEFNFDLEEEYLLLTSLMRKVTANEVLVLSRKSSDQFEFLAKLDTAQIYTLITDENPQIQSIILTQVTSKQRLSLFKLFEGQRKVSLMNELCRADSIPKEYLYNVARALSKKVSSRPEFDTQNLRSSDVLLDLLEKSKLNEQRKIMNNLMVTNPEAGRAIKIKLVTPEMLPFLKGGHLLELVIGLEREDLLTFLAGTEDHIRDLIISHAPEELSESWVEDLDDITSVNDEQYQIVEMRILAKIRSLATSGVLNILEINDMIFSPSTSESTSSKQNLNLPKSNVLT